MSTLARKKNVRGGHRGSATKSIKRVDELLPHDPPDIDELMQIKLKLTEKLDVLNRLDSEILDIVNEEDVAGEIEQADEFKEGIHSVLIKIERIMSRHTAAAAAAVSTAAHVDPATTTVGAHTASSASRIKLPKLTIQPFSGELTEWIPFWESYCAAIHDNTNLTDVEKFNYLRSFLQRPALEAISGLSLTGANYKEAVSVLEKRFGSKQRIIAKHIDALMTLEAVTTLRNLQELRQLCDSVEQHTRSLKTLGVSLESYNNLLAPVFMSKIPCDLQLLVSREVSEDEWKLNKMMEVITKELQARERTTSLLPPSVPRKMIREPPPTGAALFTNTNNGPSCSYCQQNHPSNSCNVVSQPQDRKSLLQKSGRCFNCLRRGHISRDCHSRATCTACGGKHHISICIKNTGSMKHGASDVEPSPQTGPLVSNSGTDSGVASKHTPPAGINVAATQFKPSSSLNLWTYANQTVLLQTAQAQVFNPLAPQRSQQVRIVLDSGSQQSFVAEQVARKLPSHEKRNRQ